MPFVTEKKSGERYFQARNGHSPPRMVVSLTLVHNLDDGGSVALSRDFVGQHGLPDAAVTPEDSDKMIYLVAGYHQLHCAVRWAILLFG